MTSTISLTASINTGTSITTTTTTTTTTVNDSTTSKPHITSQLFLQSASCQAISGTFAWVALIITIHHVSLDICLLKKMSLLIS
jgi:hypothetical protein